MTSRKKFLWAFSALGTFLLLSKTDTVKKVLAPIKNSLGNLNLPRGLRNNNPLNLRKGVSWPGRTGDDGAFDIFKTVDYGLRAGLQNLKTHYNRGQTSVAKLITVWAPPSENDTQSYIDFVCKTAHITPGEKINWADKQTVASILYAMAQMENGPDVTIKALPFGQVLAVVNTYA